VLSVIAALGLAARVVLFAVFALAGVTKLADRAGTARAAAAFGAPRRLASPLAIAIPVAELAVAALILPAATAVAGAAGALALLAVFSTAIAISLAHGRSIDCHCFGSTHSAPISAKTLARNAGLAAVAAIAFAASLTVSPLSAVAWVGQLHGAELVAGAATTAAVVILVGATLASLSLLRAYGRLLRRVDELERQLNGVLYPDGYEEAAPQLGLQPGSPAPLAGVVDLDGHPVAPAEPRRAVLVFTSPQCGPCRELLPDVGRWQRTYAGRLTFAVAVDGTADDARAERRDHGLEQVIVDDGAALADAFQAHATPTAVLVDHDGSVASWVAGGVDAIRDLVRLAATPAPVSVGEPAPEVEVETLDGAPFSLAALRGRAAALVFWNPGCGFCRQMHEQLRDYAASIDGEGPSLVIASSGTREATASEDFQSTVLLDEDQQLASAFGAHGTPMAVLLDEDGTVASGVAAGESAVFDLLAPPGLVVTQVGGRK
jgi:thiol-disulfide isomerase/thioredoxin